MTKSLKILLFFLSCLFSSAIATGQTFTFECLCAQLTGDSCDLCPTNTALFSRSFKGLLIYRNGNPYKWIDSPYTSRRLKNNTIQFIEQIPNPDQVTIALFQTQFSTMEGFVDSTYCQCSDVGTTYTAGPGIVISNDTISAVDTSYTNELQHIDTLLILSGSLYVSLSDDGVPASVVVLPVPDGSETKVNAGTGISVTGIGTIANPYVVTNTGDLSNTNELQTYGHAGTSTYTNTLSGGGGSWSITGAGIAVISQTGGAITVTATEVDGSVTNEIQNLSLVGQALGISGGGTGVTLPVINVSAGTGVAVSSSSGNFTVSVTAAGLSKWTDAGAYTYLTQTGDRVVVGSSTELNTNYTYQVTGAATYRNAAFTTNESVSGFVDIRGGTMTALPGSTHNLAGLNIQGTMVFNSANQTFSGLRINLTTNATASQYIIPLDIVYSAASLGGGRVFNSGTGGTEIAVSGNNGVEIVSMRTPNGGAGGGLLPGFNYINGANTASWNLGAQSAGVFSIQTTSSSTNPNSVNSSFFIRNTRTFVGSSAANTTPSATLQVKGEGATSSTYDLIVTNSGAVTATATIAARSDGFTGFGTNAPAQTVHVQGTMRVTGNSGTATGVMGRNAAGDVSALGLSGISISGGTLTADDVSPTNELQTYGHAGTTTYTNTLSSGGGSWSITGAGIAVISQTGGAITVTATEVDGSVTNEGIIGVGAGGASSSVITSTTSGATGVTVNVAGILSISESTASNGGSITLTATEVDGSTTNEVQTISASGAGPTSYNIDLNLSGGSVTVAEGSGIDLTRSGNTITIAATGSTTAYVNGGNSFGANATIGLNDNFRWDFKTNNLVRGGINSGGTWWIGATPLTTAAFNINGLQGSNGMLIAGGGSLVGPDFITLTGSGSGSDATLLTGAMSMISGNVLINVENTSATGSGGAVIQTVVSGASTGDPKFQAETSTTIWSWGIDKSAAGQPWKLRPADDIGSTALGVTVLVSGFTGINQATPVQELQVTGTGGIAFPRGSTAQRLASPTIPIIRANNEYGGTEIFDPSKGQWYRHSCTSSPTFTVGASAGTGASAGIVAGTGSNDLTGVFFVTTGTSPGTGTYVTATFSFPFDGTTTVVMITPANDPAMSQSNLWRRDTQSNTAFTLRGVGLPASTTFQFNYQVMQ